MDLKKKSKSEQIQTENRKSNGHVEMIIIGIERITCDEKLVCITRFNHNIDKLKI